MRVSLPAVLLFALACTPITTADTDLPTPTATGGDTPTTTPPLYDDEGSIVLLMSHPNRVDNFERITLAGVFAESTREWHNLGQCLAIQDETFCADALPTTYDDYVDVRPWSDTITGPLVTLDIGDQLTFGQYTVDRITLEGVYAYYSNALINQGSPTGPLGVSWSGGVWGDYTEEAVVDTPDKMVITGRDPTKTQTFPSGAPWNLSWEPGTVGDVYLAVMGPNLTRLYKLYDDGSYDIDFSTMGLVEGDSVTLFLSRWTMGQVTYEGLDIEVIVEDEQIFIGEYRDMTGRTEVIPQDTCTNALNMAPIQSGSYFGRTTGFANNQNLTSVCLGSANGGPDGWIKVELPPDASITAMYRQLANDATIALVDDCNNALGTCLDGSSVAGVGGWETIDYTNTTGSDMVAFLSLDTTSQATDLFELDVEIDLTQANAFHDSCADAIASTAIPAGLYVGDITPYHNYTDPAGYPCYLPAPGQDGIAKVALNPGETVTATATMTGADTVVYYLYNCAISVSCAAGGDASTGATETASYTNTSNYQENIYLVIDSHGGSGPYTVDVAIQ